VGGYLAQRRYKRLEKKVKNSKSQPLFTDDVMVLVRGRRFIYGVTLMFFLVRFDFSDLTALRWRSPELGTAPAHDLVLANQLGAEFTAV
jgi:hypothetical protein